MTSRRGRKKLTTDEVKRLRKLWNEGYTRSEIAGALDISLNTVGNYIKMLEELEKRA